MKKTSSTLFKSAFSFFLLCIFYGVGGNFVFSQYSSTMLSEEWVGTGGNGTLFSRSVTKSSLSSNVYVVGATINGYNNSDILIQKFHRRGALLWQQEYAGIAGQNDFATDVFIDNSENIYVTGSLVDTITQGNDLVVLKYNSSGVFQWKYTYHNSNIMLDDSGISITGDNSGKIYVTGSSGGDTTLFDYVTIALNASTGAQVWESRYDYAQLLEAPRKIEYVSVLDKIIVTGASQENYPLLRWEVATVSYLATNGTQTNVTRTNTSTIPQTTASIGDMVSDNNGNLYITGSLYNDSTISNDVALLKFDTDLQLTGLFLYDFNGYDDKGNGIKLDNYGNIYITGYSTTIEAGKEVAILKIDSTGALIWKREITGAAGNDDEGIQLVIKERSLLKDDIFIAAKVKNTTKYDYLVYMLNQDGEIQTSMAYDGMGLNNEPQSIAIDWGGNIIVTGISQTGASTYETKTVMYSIHRQKITPAYIDSITMYNQNEIIVRFNELFVKNEAVNNKRFTAGMLSDFIDSTVILSLDNKLGMNCSRLPAFKVFNRMTKEDSISITRLGDTIKLEPFWATLIVSLPIIVNEQQVIDSLNTMKDSMIRYAELNYIGELSSIPNDNLYSSEQTGLYSGTHGINIENAWNKQVGKNYVKVGIYDTGINWRHEDFGNGTWNGSKIVGGWDYYNNTHPSNQITPDENGHGTACAGIIGALRNNNIGIAGIAGGDMDNNNKGVQLFSNKIAQQATTFVLHSVISSAIVEGSTHNPNTGYGYGLHIQNHSWAGPYSVTLRQGVKSCYLNNCIFSVASGNTSNTQLNYPATFNDNWVMKVGANDQTGSRANFSTYGTNLDFIAPGTWDIYATLNHNNDSGYEYEHNGTSFAAPHVSGVAALMYSEHNPINHNEYPQKLAPDDIEAILQNTATDVGAVGYDSQNGHGRVNAGYALSMTSLPYRVRHFQHTVNTSSATLYASNQTVTFPEGIPGLAQGLYVSSTDIYKLTVTLNHTLPVDENYINGWVRNSVCDLYSLSNSIANPHWSGVVMNNSSQNNATLTGFIYKAKIYNVLGQHVQNKWFPVDLNSNVKFGYSIHTVDDNPHIGIEEITQNTNIHLFPNPTRDKLNIVFDNKINLSHIKIYDITGKLVNQQIFTSVNNNIQHEIIDVSNLINGLYLCKLVFDDEEFTYKFLKH